ncbi:MAG: hypothetical protein NXH80_10995 [Rhodobacteraceae bacterium]|nr:hypothetical protein [Paracoccaceae bacterium]
MAFLISFLKAHTWHPLFFTPDRTTAHHGCAYYVDVHWRTMQRIYAINRSARRGVKSK